MDCRSIELDICISCRQECPFIIEYLKILWSFKYGLCWKCQSANSVILLMSKNALPTAYAMSS